jgi:hypothetical protein
MAAGTITLTRAAPTLTTTELPVHGFLVPGGDFDPSRCLSYKEFTVNPNQKYLLFTSLVAPTVKVNGDDSLEFEQGGYRLCYKISMKKPGTALIVGEKTPLTLLLSSGCINAASFTLYRDDFRLISNQEQLIHEIKIGKKPFVSRM